MKHMQLVQTAKQLLLIERFIVYSSSLSCSRLLLVSGLFSLLCDFNISVTTATTSSATQFNNTRYAFLLVGIT